MLKTQKEILEEREKEKKALLERAEILKQYGTLDVNQDFLDKYVENTNNFFKTSYDDFSGVNYGNSSSMYNQKTSEWNNLDATGRYIRNWLESNKAGIGADSYNSFNKVIDEITKGGASVLDAYRGAYEGYSEYASEDEFNAAMEQVKLTKEMETADLDALLREIEEMKAEEKRRKKLFYNHPTATSYKYSAIDDIDKAIAEKEVYYNKAKRLQTGIELASVANNEDFDLYDDYKSTVDNRGFWEQVLGEGDTTDLKYEYINNQYEAKGADDWIKYKQMTDDEIKVYNYLYSKEGRDKANEFLDSIEETLNSREAEQIYENVKGKTGLEVLFGVASGLEQFTSGIENAFNFTDDYIPQSTVQQAGAMMRNDLVDNGFKIFGTSLGQMAYDALNTGANMLPSILVNVAVPGAGTVLMGASAAGNAKADALRKGMSKGQANMYGAMVGASEALLEKFLGGFPGISKGGVFSKLGQKALSKIDHALARVAITLGTDMLDEGLEESLQTVLEPWFESVVTKADYNAPNIDEILYSGLLGAISSFGFSGASITLNTAIANADAKSEYSNLDDLGALMQEGKELGGKSLDIYNKIADRYSKGKDITGGQIRQLIESNERIIGKSDKAKIQDAVKQRLNQLGETENVDKITNIITKKMMGEKLSFVDEFTIRNSKFGQRVLNEAENVGNENYTSKWATEIGTEGYGREKYSTNYDSTLDSNNNEVNISEVSVKNGTVKTESGQTVKIESLQLGTRDKALLDIAKKYKFNDEVATQFFNGYADAKKDGLSVEEYARGFAEAYIVGEYGMPEAELTSGGLASVLSESSRKLAYKLGETNAKYEISKKQEKIDQAKKNAVRGNKTFTAKGRVNYDSKIDLDNLNERQKVSLATIERIAKIFGVKVYVYESMVDGEGKRLGANGFFDATDNSIHLDLYAGRDGNSLMLYTMSHELTHFIRKWSPAKFKVLSDILMEYYGEQGISVQELVESQIQKAANNGRDIDYDTAFEEVIADSCEKMLTDEKVLREISARVKQADVGLWNKIKSFFANIIAKIKSVYKDTSPDSPEGQYVTKLLEMGDKLQKAWVEGLVEASESYKALGEENIEISTSTESVAPISYSERTWTASEYVTKRKEMAEAISKKLGISKNKAEKYIDDINSIAYVIAADRVRLDYEASSFGSAFVSNVEYGGSFDYSTICKKRRIYTGTFSKIQQMLKDTVLSPDDILEIRNMLLDAGIEATCGLCYVEGSRANMGKFASEFIRLYKRDNPNAWIPNMADVNTPDGVEKMRINHPECYEQYEYFWNHYGKLKDSDKALFASQQKPKLYESRKEYKGEILKNFKNDTSVEKKNLNGGIRMQSFSDFEIVHLIDTMQVIMDMSVVGLNGQAYTKVPEFALAFGNTNLKINLSLIAKGVDNNGKLIFDDVEGMPHSTAFELRNRFSKNVGTIIVTFTDEQLYAAMADERIDYIIPFHRSQWKKSQYGAMGLPKGTKDYTYMQNEKLIKQTYHEYKGKQVKDKATNYMPNEYWDFSKSGKENAEAYLEMCAKNNKRPKFYKLLDYDGNGKYSLKTDGSTDGYWKLLIDFKMYDNNGVGSPQMPVTPTFEMNEAYKMLNEYKGGHQNYPVANGVVDKFVSKYKKEHNLKLSDRDSTYLDAVNRGDMETAQRMVDEVARLNGYDTDAYHGTNQGNFTTFDWDKTQRADGGFYGRGHYFTKSESVAKLYGDRIIKGKLKLGKSFVWSEEVNSYQGKKAPELLSRNIVSRINMAKLFPDIFANKTMSYWEYDIKKGENIKKTIKWSELENIVNNLAKELTLREYADGTYKWHTDGKFWEVPVGESYSSVEKANEGKFFAAINALKEKYDGLLSDMSFDDQTTYTQQYGTEITEILKNKGYASAMDTHEGGEIVVFDSNQVKSADPITYDADGNVIPLSERFNPKNDDIRYSDRNSYREGLSEIDRKSADEVIESLRLVPMASKYKLNKYASYTTERIDYAIRSSKAAFVPDYATSYIAWIRPDDFLYATTVSHTSVERIKQESTKLDIERLRNQIQPIHLVVDFETGQITGHEGRHRLTALKEAGIEKVAVIIDARHHDLYHTKAIKTMRLEGQKFGDAGRGSHFYLHDAIPLSERYENIARELFAFNNKSGVMYSDRDNTSVSNRSLLANALESVAQNDIEKKKLNEYKAEVDLLDADEVKLREIKAQIKELSFAEGQRDTAKIKSLKEEATKLENRINIRDKKLLGLESTTALKNVLDREKTKAIKRERENAKLREQGIKVKAREHEANMIAATKSLAKQKLLDSHEARSKREERAKLQKTVLDTIKWLQSPSKTDVKCPDVLKEPLLELLEKIDLTSQRQLKGGASTINDEMIARRLQTLANTVKQISNSQNPTMNGIQGNQNSLLDAGYLDLPQDFVDDLNDLADAITQRGTNYGYDAVNRLTSTEIKALRKMLTQLTKSIKDIAKLGANSRFSNVIELGNESINYLKSLGNIAKTNIAVDFMRWGNALPYYAFKKFGSAGESIFEELMDAQDKLAFLSQDILNFKEKTWTNKEVQSWSKDKIEIQLDSGETINPTIAQVMGIYCLSQRVTANGDYIGLNHMLGGGITLVGEETKTGKIADKGTLLTGDDVIRICNMLDARQKQVAEKIQEFMSTVCSNWGNEISMKRFMTKEFTETKYYPLESDDTNLKTRDPGQDQSDLFRLLNISATKALTKNANNRIFIRDIFDVFANHASDMARLNAYGMAILDYMKWLNYQNKSYSSTSTQVSVESVKGAMKDAFGSKAQGYLVNLIKDINGRSGDAVKFAFLSKAMKRAKIASVGANIRVAALQFTSYARANMVLSNKSLALGLTKKPQIKKAQKYCGIALWKSFGFFDTNIAKTIEEQIKGSKNFMDKLVELSMKGAEYADAITWGFLWNSCEYEVAKTTQHQVGTEEFYKEVGLKLREVVYSTQVVDSVLTRSQLMRSKDGLTQSLTAFMSEPTLSTNILADATWKFNEAKRTSGSAKQAWKTTRKIIGKTIANYCVMQISVSLLESLFDAWRDDEDEKFIKKYGEAFLQNISSNINPLSNIPVSAKVVDAILYLCGVGYRVSNNDLGMQWLDNIVNAGTTWKEVIAEETGGKDTSKTVFKAINDTIKALSSLVGLPLGNAMREVVALWNNTAGAVDPTLKLHSYENTNEELGNLLYEAIIKGKDTSNIEAEFDNPKSIKSALKKALKNNDSRITEAAQYYYNGDLDEYSEIFDEIFDEGNFESDIIKGAINSVVNDIEKQNKTETEDEVDEEKVYSKYTNNDVNIAFDNGDNALAKEIINELIDVKMQNGMDEKSAKASVKSTMTSHYKELFIEAYKTKNKTEQARIRKILYKSGLYGSTDDVIKTTNAWLTKK